MRAPSPGQLEQSFARANQLQAELGRKERAIGRKVQVLAKGLAGLMEPGARGRPDEFDSFRELVAGALDVYLSTINNNLSAIMKRLTGVTVILAGIGAIGGLFGMSQATPALSGQEGFGFWAITIGSVGLAALAVAFLRWIDWI